MLYKIPRDNGCLISDSRRPQSQRPYFIYVWVTVQTMVVCDPPAPDDLRFSHQKTIFHTK